MRRFLRRLALYQLFAGLNLFQNFSQTSLSLPIDSLKSRHAIRVRGFFLCRNLGTHAGNSSFRYLLTHRIKPLCYYLSAFMAKRHLPPATLACILMVSCFATAGKPNYRSPDVPTIDHCTRMDSSIKDMPPIIVMHHSHTYYFSDFCCVYINKVAVLF